jgi:hypothetical protein
MAGVGWNAGPLYWSICMSLSARKHVKKQLPGRSAYRLTFKLFKNIFITLSGWEDT